MQAATDEGGKIKTKHPLRGKETKIKKKRQRKEKKKEGPKWSKGALHRFVQFEEIRRDGLENARSASPLT